MLCLVLCVVASLIYHMEIKTRWADSEDRLAFFAHKLEVR